MSSAIAHLVAVFLCSQLPIYSGCVLYRAQHIAVTYSGRCGRASTKKCYSVCCIVYRSHTATRQAVTEPLYKFSGGQPTAQAVVFAKAPFIGAVVYEQRSFRLLTGRETVRGSQKVTLTKGNLYQKRSPIQGSF